MTNNYMSSRSSSARFKRCRGLGNASIGERAPEAYSTISSTLLSGVDNYNEERPTWPNPPRV